MDLRQQIAAILKRWLEMTHAENQAIRAGDWPALRQTQEAKAKLRVTLGGVIEKWKSACPQEAQSQPFRDEVARLLALETSNGDLLATAQAPGRRKKSSARTSAFQSAPNSFLLRAPCRRPSLI